MTMPSKIWYGKDPVYGCRDKVWKPNDVICLKNKEPRGQDWQKITPYIRADITKELAQALEVLASHPAHDKTAMGRRAMQALARYNEITP